MRIAAARPWQPEKLDWKGHGGRSGSERVHEFRARMVPDSPQRNRGKERDDFPQFAASAIRGSRSAGGTDRSGHSRQFDHFRRVEAVNEFVTDRLPRVRCHRPESLP